MFPASWSTLALVIACPLALLACAQSDDVPTSSSDLTETAPSKQAEQAPHTQTPPPAKAIDPNAPPKANTAVSSRELFRCVDALDDEHITTIDVTSELKYWVDSGAVAKLASVKLRNADGHTAY